MKRLDSGRRELIAAALVEGNSVRATARLTGAAVTTILRFVEDMGWAAAMYLDEHMVDLPCQRLQVDEIWAFCYAKDKNVPEAMRRRPTWKGGCPAGPKNLVGSVWTWTAIDADTKLMPTFHVGTRDAGCASEFMNDLAGRLRGRVQLTTDGHQAYIQAVGNAFGREVDYAMLVKLYGSEPAGEARYSPPKCVGTRVEVKQGDPDPEHISTSYAERSNLTLRMGSRRFTRLTNGFSKKCENLEHGMALHLLHYNYVRRHMTLKTTPAVAAGIADRPWTMTDLLGVLGEVEGNQIALR
jgi:IS1 family transposase